MQRRPAGFGSRSSPRSHDHAGRNHPFGGGDQRDPPPHPQHPPVTTQPRRRQSAGHAGHASRAGLNWMPMPHLPPGWSSGSDCPPGLEYLSRVDYLLVEQAVDLLEVFTGWERTNQYRIWNADGQLVYLAVEVSNVIMRQVFGASRLFDMRVLDSGNREVMHFYRPTLLPPQVMEVTAPVGELVGYVTQVMFTCCVPEFRVEDERRRVLLRIKGPCCTNPCCGDIPFAVLTAAGQRQVGEIRKEWAGYTQEHFTNADNFGITFPTDASVKTKALLLAACFLIDFMHFERTPAENRRRRGRYNY